MIIIVTVNKKLHISKFGHFNFFWWVKQFITVEMNEINIIAWNYEADISEIDGFNRMMIIMQTFLSLKFF